MYGCAAAARGLARRSAASQNKQRSALRLLSPSTEEVAKPLGGARQAIARGLGTDADMHGRKHGGGALAALLLSRLVGHGSGEGAAAHMIRRTLGYVSAPGSGIQPTRSRRLGAAYIRQLVHTTRGKAFRPPRASAQRYLRGRWRSPAVLRSAAARYARVVPRKSFNQLFLSRVRTSFPKSGSPTSRSFCEASSLFTAIKCSSLFFQQPP